MDQNLQPNKWPTMNCNSATSPAWTKLPANQKLITTPRKSSTQQAPAAVVAEPKCLVITSDTQHQVNSTSRAAECTRDNWSSMDTGQAPVARKMACQLDCTAAPGPAARRGTYTQKPLVYMRRAQPQARCMAMQRVLHVLHSAGLPHNASRHIDDLRMVVHNASTQHTTPQPASTTC